MFSQYIQVTTSVILATSLLVSFVDAHTYLYNPVPFPSQLFDNGPVAKDGSDWPCKGETDYDTYGVSNIWPLGSTQQLHAIGEAVHGGGSCQISITYDTKPTRKSQWKVIHSIHGGCPARHEEGNLGYSSTTLLSDVYNFTIPDFLPLGPAVMAWTWFGRWSVPEMFMNCAPVVITGGQISPSLHSVAISEGNAELQLPNLFEANNGNGCWTRQEGSCIMFPDPGESLETNTGSCPFEFDNMFKDKEECRGDNRLSGSCSGLCGFSWTFRSLGVMFLLSSLLLFLLLALSVRRKLGSKRGRYKKLVGR